MDLFVEGCQGLGLALAVGAAAGALAGSRPGDGALMPVAAVLAAIAGAVLFGWSLTQADHPAWPGWPVGAAFALFAFVVVAGFVAGARRRSGEAPSSALAMPVLLVVIALAGISLVLGPVSLLALVALLYLAAARRRRAGRKYEGLRVLR